MPAKTIQEILGHSRIGTTLDIYTHVAGADRAAILRHATDAMDQLLAPPSPPPSASRRP